MRTAKTAVGLAVLGSLALGAGPALAATTPSTPAGGPVKVFATPNPTGAGGTIVIVGAIGDYGRTLTINKNGTTNANGNYVRITLQKGTFEVNSTALNAKADKAQPTGDLTTCSGSLSVTGPVTLSDGTGLYRGISGTVSITETFAYVAARFTTGKHKGLCNESAQPIGQYGSITGTGTVSFS
ncbi:MAG: hypothetical protein ACLQVK_16855 [Acidimicrobiales bacterium]